MATSEIVELNIGGYHFETTKDTLLRYDTMFNKMLSGNFAVNRDKNGKIFIDRSGKHFHTILNFMRDGDVVLPDDSKIIEEIIKEANYYCFEELKAFCTVHLPYKGPIKLGEDEIKNLKPLLTKCMTKSYTFAFSRDNKRIYVSGTSANQPTHNVRSRYGNPFSGLFTQNADIYTWDIDNKESSFQQIRLLTDVADYSRPIYISELARKPAIINGTGNGLLLLVDLQSHTVTENFGPHFDNIVDRYSVIKMSPDEKSTYFCGNKGEVYIWDIDNKQEKGRFFGHVGGTSFLDFSHNGYNLWSYGKDELLRCWDIRKISPKSIYTFEYDTELTSLCCSPIEDIIAVGSSNGKITIFNETGVIFSSDKHHSSLCDMAFTHSGLGLVTLGYYNEQKIFSILRMPENVRIMKSCANNCDRLIISYDDKYLIGNYFNAESRNDYFDAYEIIY